MSTLVAPVPDNAPRWPALIPPVLIAIPVVLKLAGVPIANPWIIFALLFGLMLTGMPISISLGLTVLTYLFTMTTVPIESVALKLFTGIEKFEIMAIPFFILAGNFLTHGGVARRMINFATSMVGHWAGGLGLAGVMACALFAAVSGSSPATVVAIGSILLPAMLKQGFPARFGAGVITTSGALGILIPPSIVMVMYAVATNTSVGALFIAGIVPGIALATLLGLTTWWRARKFNYPRQPKASWGERLAAFRESIWGLLLIIVVIGGIYSGIFTPTEAAAMSAVYAFFVAVFVYKDMTLAKVPKVLLDSANMSAMLLYIITNAVMFSYLMTSEQIPQELAAWMLGKGLGVIAFLLFVNVVLLLAGNVMEPSSIVLIMAPILFPVAIKLGIDPVHFGIMMVVNMEVGMCHPPVGLNLYVASGITKMGITELTVAVWPWLLTMLGFLVVVTYWPPTVDLAAEDARHDVAARLEARPLRAPRRCRRGARSICEGDGRRGTWAWSIVEGRSCYNFEFTRFYPVGVPEWRLNARFPSSSPMRWRRMSSARSTRASRPTVSPSSPRRCAGCRARKRRASTPFIASARFSRTWSNS